jgi:hypothetical protein
MNSHAYAEVRHIETLSFQQAIESQYLDANDTVRTPSNTSRGNLYEARLAHSVPRAVTPVSPPCTGSVLNGSHIEFNKNCRLHVMLNAMRAFSSGMNDICCHSLTRP